MKYIILFFSLTLLLGCSDDKTKTEIKTEQVLVQQPVTELPTTEFIKYPTVIQMLKESYDFTEDEGSLKILSKDGEPLRLQVSKIVMDADFEKVIKEQTMRDIIYVAFKSFAQTNIDELTIISVPMKAKGKYVEKYKLTVTINREKAKSVLKKYLKTENFQLLFKLDGTVWVPDENFSVLMYKKLDPVFSDI